MNDTLKKHWTTMLGALFVIAALITLFQYTVDMGWITDMMKIGIGLVVGLGVSIVGVNQARQRERVLLGDILLGIGSGVLYATFTFSGVYFDLWEPTHVMLGMVAVTAALGFYAHKYHSRILMNIALVAGMLSPLLMRPETDQVFTLFVYMFVLNAGALIVSIAKGWNELKISGFIGSWLMYIVYFIHFSPSVDGFWNMPIRYAIAAFLFYTIGLFLASWRSKLSFDGQNLYLHAVNGILFGFWALVIWHGEVDYGFVLAGIGLVYLAAGFFIYKLCGKMQASSISFMAGSVLLILMSINSFGEGVLFNVIMWTGYAVLLTFVGQWRRWFLATLFGVLIWFYVGVYWYCVTWYVPRGEWFGIYIPFLNWGAFAWIALAALGFYYARKVVFPGIGDNGNMILSRVFALFSHLIVGGLMARQIENMFTEYWTEAPAVYEGLTLSIVWGIYALLLVLWGAYFRERIFTWFGSAVLVFVAVKAIFMDLSGQEALLKALVLLVLGAVSFLITWVNKKWSVAVEAAAPQAGLEPEPVQTATVDIDADNADVRETFTDETNTGSQS